MCIRDSATIAPNLTPTRDKIVGKNMQFENANLRTFLFALFINTVRLDLFAWDRVVRTSATDHLHRS